jgi:hypothetical protein
MTIITPTDRPVLYAVTGELGGQDMALNDVARVGEQVGIAEALDAVSDVDENTFIAAVPADAFPALPDSGWLEAGAIYAWNGIAVMVRQSHNRTEHDPDTVLALFLVHREDAGEALDWVAGEPVQVGTRRLYDGTEYQALQAHITQGDWTPVATLGVLWAAVTPPTADWAVGVAYTGDNTAGAGNGDHVLYLGNEYRCLQSHTSIQTWNPVATLDVLWRRV